MKTEYAIDLAFTAFPMRAHVLLSICPSVFSTGKSVYNAMRLLVQRDTAVNDYCHRANGKIVTPRRTQAQFTN
jgi:hypothetical protein